MPAAMATKVALAMGKVLPLVTYGAATTPAAKSEVRRLRSKLATMFVPGAAFDRSVDLALLTAAPKNLGPVTVFWLQRISAFR
eukprot:11765011-Alexandrium_andersonii.AAC.1